MRALSPASEMGERGIPDQTTNGLELLGSAKTVLLTTFKRDGTAVGTPVSIALDGERAYFRTWDKAWKAKRIANNPQVEVAPAPFGASRRGSHSPSMRGYSKATTRDWQPRCWRNNILSCRRSLCL